MYVCARVAELYEALLDIALGSTHRREAEAVARAFRRILWWHPLSGLEELRAKLVEAREALERYLKVEYNEYLRDKARRLLAFVERRLDEVMFGKRPGLEWWRCIYPDY